METTQKPNEISENDTGKSKPTLSVSSRASAPEPRDPSTPRRMHSSSVEMTQQVTNKVSKNNKPNENQQLSEILVQLGLNDKEALIYSLLLKAGPTGIKPILSDTGLKRGNAYYHLDSLIAKGMVKKLDEKGKPVRFMAKHPENLELLLAKQKNRLFEAEDILKRQLPELRSLYQLIALKPGVKFYEGSEGAKKIVEDTLTSRTEVYSYTDLEIVDKFFSQYNQSYVGQRKEKGITKKMIVADSIYNRQHAKSLINPNTDIKLISGATSFAAIMYIYDNKISYINLDPKHLISTIIEHQSFYKMHKSLFELHWQNALKI